jgi:hypothetical protein
MINERTIMADKTINELAAEQEAENGPAVFDQAYWDMIAYRSRQPSTAYVPSDIQSPDAWRGSATWVADVHQPEPAPTPASERRRQRQAFRSAARAWQQAIGEIDA